MFCVGFGFLGCLCWVLCWVVSFFRLDGVGLARGAGCIRGRGVGNIR